MSVSREIKSIFAIDGEKKYSDAIKDINDKQKMLSAEMKAAGAAFDANGDKQGKLKSQTEYLTKQIDLQKQKVAESKAAMDQAKTKYDATSETVQKLSKDYLYAQASLSKMQGDLISSTQALALQESKLKAVGDAAQRAGEKMKTSGAQMNQVGSAMTSGITMPAIAAAAALGTLVVKTLESADEIALASEKYDMTTDRIQELTYAGKGLDVELDTMLGSQSKLIKSMTAAKDPTSKQAEEFKKLKIEVKNADGSLRDSNVVWGEVIDKIGQMPNTTEASSTAMILLGKSAMDLNPLIRAGSEELAKLSGEAHTTGAVLSDVKIASLDKFGDAIEKAKVSIGTAAGEITVELLPTLEKLLPLVEKDIVPAIKDGAEVIGEWAEAFSDFDPLAKKTVLTLAGLLVVAGPLLKGVGTAMITTGGLTSNIGKLTSTIAAQAANTAGAAVATEGLAAAEVTATGAGASLALTLGPILLVVAAVAALGVGYYTLSAESRAVTEAVIEQTEAMNASNDAANASIESAEEESAATKTMADDLFRLAEMENKTTGQKAAMQGLILSLNKSIPDLNLAYDAQTDSLNKNKDAVYKAIKAKEDEIKLSAYADKLKNDYVNDAKQTDLGTKALERYNKALKEAFEVTLNPVESAKRTMELYYASEAIKAVAESQEITTESLKKSEEEYGVLYESINESNQAIVESTQETTELTKEELDAQQQARDEWAQNMESAASKYQSEMGSIDQFGIEQSKQTAAEWKANLDQQVVDMQNWRTNMLLIAPEVPEGFLEYLRELGPGEAQILQDFVDANTEERAAMVTTWQEWGAEVEQAAIDEIGKAPDDAGTIGTDTGFAFVNALNKEMAGATITTPTIPAPVFPSISIPGISSSSNQQKKKVPAYASGSKYIPEDQIALIHEGEAVIPKDQNPYAKGNLASSTVETFDVGNKNMSTLENARKAANAMTSQFAAGENMPSSSGTSQSGVSQIVHSGELTVRGVNNQGETVGAAQIIMDKLKWEHMMSGR